jgi:ABC-type uncharacterized transport system substrate-binding protein
MIDRREFLGTLALGLLTAPLAAVAQQAGKVTRIGILDYAAPDPARVGWWEAFRERLRELGYVEGQHVIFEPRWGNGDVDRLSSLTAEMVNAEVDIIVTAGSEAVLAAKRATSSIPIVMATGVDPVALGIVASLARPGGNVTGVTSIQTELAAKRLELFRQLLPGVSRIAILWDTDNRASELLVRHTEVGAKSLRIALQSVRIQSPKDAEAAFSAMKRDRAAGVILAATPRFMGDRRRIADLAVRHRLPMMVGAKEYAEAGGLVSYATDYPDLFRQAAIYVDKILHGAKPGDLPVEQPTKFELVINLKTAKALGLTIPPSLLLRADEVIE